VNFEFVILQGTLKLDIGVEKVVKSPEFCMCLPEKPTIICRYFHWVTFVVLFANFKTIYRVCVKRFTRPLLAIRIGRDFLAFVAEKVPDFDYVI